MNLKIFEQINQNNPKDIDIELEKLQISLLKM